MLTQCPGVDAAGVIDSVGESIKDFEPGDEVFCLCGMSIRADAFQDYHYPLVSRS